MSNDLADILAQRDESAVPPPSEAKAAPAVEPAAAIESDGDNDAGGQSAEHAERGQVPLAALQAERQKAKRYTEEVAELKHKLTEMDRNWANRFEQLQKAHAPAAPVVDPVDALFQSPDEYISRAAAAQIQPLQAKMHAMARQYAEMQFKPETVEEAVQAFDAAVKSRALPPEVYQRVMESVNPFAESVKWHEQRKLEAEIGGDPAAYRDKLRAQILAEINGGERDEPNAGRRAPVMPTDLARTRNVGSRSVPEWSGPEPLASIFANMQGKR